MAVQSAQSFSDKKAELRIDPNTGESIGSNVNAPPAIDPLTGESVQPKALALPSSTTSVSAHTPGFWEGVRSSLFDTSIGEAIRQNAPWAPDWMQSHINHTADEGQERRYNLLNLGALADIGKRGDARPGAGRSITKGVLDVGSGLTSPENLLVLATAGPIGETVAGGLGAAGAIGAKLAPVATKALPAYFTAQVAKGTYESGTEEYRLHQQVKQYEQAASTARNAGDNALADQYDQATQAIRQRQYELAGSLAANAAMLGLGSKELFHSHPDFIGPKVDPTDPAYWGPLIPRSIRGKQSIDETPNAPNPVISMGKISAKQAPEQSIPASPSTPVQPAAPAVAPTVNIPKVKVNLNQKEAKAPITEEPETPFPSSPDNRYFTQEEWEKYQKSKPASSEEPTPTRQENPSPQTPPESTVAPKKKGNVNRAAQTEQQMRPIVQTMVRTAQLSKAASQRLEVERALNSAAASPLSMDELNEYKSSLSPEEFEWMQKNMNRENENPFIDTKASYDELGPKEKGTVDAVAKTLNVSPKDLEENSWRLTDGQVARLKELKAEGLGPVSRETGKLEDTVHGQLADINANNVEAAGLPNARDLWSQASPEDLAARKAYISSSHDIEQTGQDATFKNLEIDPETGEAVNEFSASGQKEARREGLVSERPDITRLELEHEAMQNVLKKRIAQGSEALKAKIASWQQDRSATTKPSKLAQDIAKLPDDIKALLPKELYDQKHLAPETKSGTESPVNKEPLPGTPSSKGTPISETPAEPSKPENKSDDFLGKIQKLTQTLKGDYGDEAAGALPKIYSEVKEKFSTPETVQKVLYIALRKYKAHLDNGVEYPLEQALADTVDRLKPEKGIQDTMYANPLPEIYKRVVRMEQPAGVEPLDSIPDSIPTGAIEDLTEKLQPGQDRTTTAKVQQWLQNEFLRSTRIAEEFTQDLPARTELLKSLANKLVDTLKNPVDSYKTLRFNLNRAMTPYETLRNLRQLQILEKSYRLHEFNQRLIDAFPDKLRRSAVAPWAEAHKGLQGPVLEGQEPLRLTDEQATEVLKNQVEQLETRFGKKSYVAKVYRTALELTDEEKNFAKQVTEYDKQLNQEEANAGVDHAVLTDYWEHIWKQAGIVGSVAKAIRNSIGWQTKGSFQKMRTHMTYFDGLMAGLKPTDMDAAYLLQHRAFSSAKVIANRQFVDSLRQVQMDDGAPMATLRGVGIPAPETPEGYTAGAIRVLPSALPKEAHTPDGEPYQYIDHPVLRGWKWYSNDTNDVPITGSADMVFHPDAVDAIKNDFVSKGWNSNPVGRSLMKVSSAAKNTLLSFSIFHPIALAQHAAARAALGSLRGAHGELTLPTGETYDPSWASINPMTKKPIIDLENNPLQRFAILSGLNLDVHNPQSMQMEGVTGVSKIPVIGSVWKPAHDFMMGQYIPNLSMGSWMGAYVRNMSRYFDSFKDEQLKQMGYDDPTVAPQEAHKLASDAAQWRIGRMSSNQTNYSYGLMDLREIPGLGSRGAQDTARFFLLAPRFLFSRGMLMLNSVKPGGAESLQAMALQGMAVYMLCRAANAALNNGDSKNSLEDWNKIVIGHHQYGFRSELSDAIDAYTDHRKFVAHRTNPVLRPAEEAWTGTDAYGHPVTKSQIAVDALQATLPISTQGLVDEVAPHYNHALRDSDEGDSFMNGMFSSLGVNRTQYRSPAEKEVFSDFDKIQGPPTDDDLALEQKNTFRDLRKKYQQGKLDAGDIEKAINDPKGNLKASEIPYLFRSATQTELVQRAQHLQYNQVKKAWGKATDSEKLDLVPVLIAKSKTLAPQVQAKELQEVQDYLNSVPPNKVGELEKAINNQIEWENRK